VAWDAVAGIYLLLGTVVLRRRRGVRVAPIRQADVTGWLRPVCGPRFEFACILAASLAGLTSAGAVLFYVDRADAGALAIIGSLAMVFAWCLLHAGYARFYAGLYDEGGPGGEGGGSTARPLEFPRSGHPTTVDFFYFSFTLGTSFSVSDVTVTTPSMRWHVMMHSVLSFFYNAVVLALAVGILTRR
jgi:uncharacterized membrane protein